MARAHSSMCLAVALCEPTNGAGLFSCNAATRWDCSFNERRPVPAGFPRRLARQLAEGPAVGREDLLVRLQPQAISQKLPWQSNRGDDCVCGYRS